MTPDLTGLVQRRARFGRCHEEAIPRLFRPGEAAYQNLGLARGVLAISMLLAAAPLVTLFRQKQRGAAAKAQLAELVNDELGLLAALLGTVFIVWGKPIADPIATIDLPGPLGRNPVVSSTSLAGIERDSWIASGGRSSFCAASAGRVWRCWIRARSDPQRFGKQEAPHGG